MAAEGGPNGPLIGALAAVVVAYVSGRFGRAGQHDGALGADAASLRTAVVSMSAELRALHLANEACLEKHRDCEERHARLEVQVERMSAKLERLEMEHQRRRGN